MKFTSTIVLLGLVLAAVGRPAGADEDDPIVDYYWQKARQAAKSLSPNVDGLRYQFTAQVFRHSIRRDGGVTATDTLVQDLFFSNGRLDSSVTRSGDVDAETPDLNYPAIFEMELAPHLFPNDTGGVDLPIGFLTDTTRLDLPDGLVVIDRHDYSLRALYLNYPHLTDFRRFSRCFRFVRVNDYIFPDSVWEVATELGVFFSDSYRLEVGISNVQVEALTDSVQP